MLLVHLLVGLALARKCCSLCQVRIPFFLEKISQRSHKYIEFHCLPSKRMEGGAIPSFGDVVKKLSWIWIERTWATQQ